MKRKHFSKLFKKHREELFLFCRKLTKSPSKGKDLLQNAAIKGFLNKEDIYSDEKFKSWMSSIIYNTFLSDYRKKKRRRKLLSEKKQVSAHFFNRSKTYNKGYEDLKAEDITKVSASIGKNSYKAFQLYLKGFSYKEIARQLDIALGTVKSRIYFIRKKMKSTEIAEIYAA